MRLFHMKYQPHVFINLNFLNLISRPHMNAPGVALDSKIIFLDKAIEFLKPDFYTHTLYFPHPPVQPTMKKCRLVINCQLLVITMKKIVAFNNIVF